MDQRALLAALGLVAACSGSGDGADRAASTAVTATTVAEIPVGDARFCDAFGALLVGPLAEGGFDVTDPGQLRAAVLGTAVFVNELRASAPPEVAGPAGVVADQYDAAFAVLDAYGYDLARVEAEAPPAEQAVLDGFGLPPAGPGAEDPYQALESFVADRCAPGLTVPTSP